jgi:hypothetical protein
LHSKKKQQRPELHCPQQSKLCHANVPRDTPLPGATHNTCCYNSHNSHNNMHKSHARALIQRLRSAQQPNLLALWQRSATKGDAFKECGTRTDVRFSSWRWFLRCKQHNPTASTAYMQVELALHLLQWPDSVLLAMGSQSLMADCHP